MGARPNPVKEQALLSLTRSIEAQAQAASRSPGEAQKGAVALETGKSAPDGSGKAVPGASATTGASATGSVESARAQPKVAQSGSGRRIEDLPAASPIAYRSLRVDELPEAPGLGKRGRKGKNAASVGSKDGASASADAARALRIEDLPSDSAAVRPLRNDELNPDLVKKADDLLWNHPSPVGVDVPFELNGKNYVARFAYHYHEFGGAKKPWGYHKGVTLYATAD